MTARETFTIAAPELRFVGSEEAGIFEGYAAHFGQMNSLGEMITPGAFSRSLQEHNARGTRPGMFWAHNPAEVIGVWQELSEDANGLKVRGRLITETTRGREAHALLRAGAVTGLSIGFRARQQHRGPNGARVLDDVNLVEVSLVSLPADHDARVLNVRNAADPAGMAAFTQAVRRAAQSLKGK